METSGNKSSNNDSGSKRTVIIFILILFLANAFLLWQFFNKKSENTTLVQEKMEVTAAKDSITAEYNSVKAELSKLQTDNVGLKGKLTENDAEIKTQQEKIEKLMKSNAGIGALRSEIAKLKALKTQYETRIADLEKQNKELTNQNTELNTNLTGEKAKTETLTKENQGLSTKVALGSILKADNVVMSGVRFKSSGKEITEKKAKNAKKLKVCFSINENLVADKGQKNIYIRVTSPDKTVLSSSSATFTFGGKEMSYTVKQEINFANKKVDQCVFWEKGSPFIKGKYSAEFYCDGSLIGNGEFELK